MSFVRVQEDTIVYKAAYVYDTTDKVIIHLLLPKGTTYHIDSRHAFSNSVDDKKCRATKAKVVKIIPLRGGKPLKKAVSFHTSKFVYEKGKTVKPTGAFCRLDVQCGSGVHFFFDKKDAVWWGKSW